MGPTGTDAVVGEPRAAEASIGSWRAVLEYILRLVALALTAGAIGGAIAGVASRLAMGVLARTSDPALIGTITDDQAQIGRFTLDGTAFLVMLVTVIGATVGPIYLVARRGLPTRRPRGRVAAAAAVGAAAGSLLLVHGPDTIDFGRLEPQWFAVVAFLGVPALLAGVCAWLVERWDRTDGWFAVGPLVPALLPLVAVVAPPIGIVVVSGVALALLVRRVPTLLRLWRSRATTILVRLALATVIVLGVVDLVIDVAGMIAER